MSFLLHVDSDTLYLTAHLLQREQRLLAEQILVLRQQMGRLAMAWQGGDAEEFLDAMRHLLLELMQREREVQELAQILARQADLWLESDQRWAQVYQGLRSPRRQE